MLNPSLEAKSMSSEAGGQLSVPTKPLPVGQTRVDAPRLLQVLVAFGGLLYVDLILRTGGYKPLRRRLMKSRRRRGTVTAVSTSYERVLATIDRAAMFYPRKAMCLQRSAVATWLLRRNGIAAEMVIGCRHTPFYAHAWVEVDRVVVNDVARVRELYPEMERL
jgi:hypothetical protein